MRRRPALLVLTLLLASAGLAALWFRPPPPLPPSPVPRHHIAAPANAQDFRPQPFHELAERVHDRYRGRLIGVQIAPPTPDERDLGAELVYEFRLMTPQRNLLRIRLDARSGRFLEVAGRGQIEALRKGGSRHDNEDDED